VWENTRDLLDGVLAERGERVGRDLDERDVVQRGVDERDRDDAGERRVDDPDGDERARHGTAAPDPARGELLAGTAARPGGASADAN